EDQLRPGDPGDRGGSRDGARARGPLLASLHLGVRARRLPRRPGRRALDAGARHLSGDGRVHHHRGVRGGGAGRARVAPRRLSRLAADRPVARVRAPVHARLRAGARVHGDGAGADRPALGPVRGPRGLMRLRTAAGVAIAAVVLLLPLVAGPFLRLLALLALSFNLLFGMTGLLSFGQGAFYAGGAYSAALLLRAGIPLLWSILLGAVAAAALAAVLGAFCVRHTRIYFSMLTLAFGMLVYAVVWKWTPVTGGDDGLIGIPRGRLGLPGPLDVSLDSPVSYYLFTAILVL